jgi:hypothetical protein
MNTKPLSMIDVMPSMSKVARLSSSGAGAVHNQAGQLYRRSKLLYAKPVSIIFVIAGLLVAALSLGFYQPATATHTAVAIVAYPAESFGETLSLVKVYAEPDDSSQLLRVEAPGKQIDIRGLSENGAWVAMSNEDESGVAGWITTAEIRKNTLTGTTISLVKVYRQPNSASDVAEVIPPAAKVQVLGHNPDKTWIAIARPEAKGSFIRWVAASDLKMPAGYMKSNLP